MTQPPSRFLLQWWKPALFLLVLILGLWYVKWQPYYGKAFFAAQTQSIGDSILVQSTSSPLYAAWDYTAVYFKAIWKAAIFGLLLGSLIQVLIPYNWLQRSLGKPRFGSTLLGTLFAVPCMMCTCCTAPISASMRQQRASMGSALAFWLGNPLLNPATLVFMGFVLGWQFALIRAVAGIIMVPMIATLVQRWVSDPGRAPGSYATHPVTPVAAAANVGFFTRWLASLWSFALNTVPIYIVAVLALGAAQAWLFPPAQALADNTLFWVVAMATIGAIFVIPTAAEIPIVQTMLLAGMGMAPALALLITLPAISLPSLLMLRKEFPAKALWLTAALVVLSGSLVGAIAMLYS